MVPADVTVASSTTPSYTVQLDSNGMAVGGQYFETAIAGSVTVASGVTESMPVVVPLDVSLSLGRHQFVTSYFGNQHYSAASAVTTFTVVDGTGPEVAATVEGTQHSSGWFTANVKITWTVSTTIRHRVINRLWPGHGYRGIGGRDHADVHRDERGRHDHEVNHHSKGCHATGNHLAARWRDLSNVARRRAPPGLVTMRSRRPDCTASVALGSPLDTSITGEFDFAVTAIDAIGNRAERTVKYSSHRPPTRSIGRRSRRAHRSHRLGLATAWSTTAHARS